MEVLGKNKNFLAIDSKFSSFNDSQIVVLPIPYESTTSYGKGTIDGPREILRASAYVEFYDEETNKELCFEKGIATIKQLKLKKLSHFEAFNEIQSFVSRILDTNKFLVCIGGEHSITYPIVKTFYNRYPQMSILQFDAHSDLRQVYEGNPFSHACVMARIIDFFPPERLVQVGIRAQCIEESQLITEKSIKTFYAWKIKQNLYGNNWIKSVVDSLSSQVYITFDVDFFDPSIMPSTGTPEPEGFTFTDATNIVREIVKSGRQVIGFDVVELSPIPSIHHPNFTAARLIYKFLNLIFYPETQI
ncbi:MAG: agmatinase [Ignavibacteria bacterium]|nr:agmatinase [Ignavibacteria bacterium]